MGKGHMLYNDEGVVVLNSVCPVKTSPYSDVWIETWRKWQKKVDPQRYAFFTEEITTTEVLKWK